MSNATTISDLWLTIKNTWTTPLKGIAVGDELLLFKIGSATFTGKNFQGDLNIGEEIACQSAADENGNGKIIFEPSPGMVTEAIVADLKPKSVVNVPENFCGWTKINDGQFKKNRLILLI